MVMGAEGSRSPLGDEALFLAQARSRGDILKSDEFPGLFFRAFRS
jgi:hypothetical protein